MIKNSKPDNVKISFHGLGVSIWKCNVSNDLLNDMRETAKLFHLPLETAIWDADFCPFLNKRTNHKIEHLYELKKNKVSGLLDSTLTQIEVWKNTRRRYKIKNLRLENSYCLFPKYGIKTIKEKFKQTEPNVITFSESYMGLIKSYRIITDNFDIDKLIFNHTEVEITVGNIYNIFTSVSYDGKLIKNIGSDNLVTNRIALIQERK